MVYILEAHASDEWPINNLPDGVSCLNQHVTLQDRQEACQLFKQSYPNSLHTELKIVLDGPDNEFNKEYPSWPFRLWIIGKDKRIEFKGMADAESGYNVNLERIKTWLWISGFDKDTQLPQVPKSTGIATSLIVSQEQYAIPPNIPISIQSLSAIPVTDLPSEERGDDETLITLSVAEETTTEEVIVISNEQ